MAAFIEAGRGTLQTALWLAVIMGLALIGGGVWLVYLGATGATELTLFGNSFKSTNVGVVGIFCGAVVAVLIFRRSFKSLDHLAKTESMEK